MKLDIKKMKMIKKIEILRLSENIGNTKIILKFKIFEREKNRILIILLLWMETAKIIQII